ncbi:MAG TPA: hypothetical protein VGA75_06525, partial [Paracoccaceae bacterium]
MKIAPSPRCCATFGSAEKNVIILFFSTCGFRRRSVNTASPKRKRDGADGSGCESGNGSPKKSGGKAVGYAEVSAHRLFFVFKLFDIDGNLKRYVGGLVVS